MQLVVPSVPLRQLCPMGNSMVCISHRNTDILIWKMTDKWLWLRWREVCRVVSMSHLWNCPLLWELVCLRRYSGKRPLSGRPWTELSHIHSNKWSKIHRLTNSWNPKNLMKTNVAWNILVQGSHFVNVIRKFVLVKEIKITKIIRSILYPFFHVTTSL